MQKPFCDGCGRELQEGIPLVSLRASVTPYTPGHTQEETAIITQNYNRDYHADCWSEREASFDAVVLEPKRYFIADDLAGIAAQVGASTAQDSSPIAEPQAESDAAKEEGAGGATAGNLGGDQEPVIQEPAPPAEEAPESDAETTQVTPPEEQPEEPPTAHEQSADSRGIAEPTLPPGVNP